MVALKRRPEVLDIEMIEVETRRPMERAILAYREDKRREDAVVLPLSLIEVHRTTRNNRITVTMPYWLAAQEELT